MESFEQREKAEFNMAVSYLNRLNALLSACDQASIGLDIYTWFHSLLALHRELARWMDDSEIKELTAKIKQIHPYIQAAINKAGKTGRLEIHPDLYMEMHEFEISLRTVLKKSGLDMKMADDAMDALR